MTTDRKEAMLHAGLGTTATDADVARRFGLTRERVRQLRKAWGIATSRAAQVAGISARADALLNERHPGVVAKIKRLIASGQPVADVNRRTGVPKGGIVRIAKQAGLARVKYGETAAARARWASIDWSMANWQIVAKHGHAKSTVAGKRSMLRRKDPTIPPSPHIFRHPR